MDNADLIAERKLLTTKAEGWRDNLLAFLLCLEFISKNGNIGDIHLEKTICLSDEFLSLKIASDDLLRESQTLKTDAKHYPFANRNLLRLLLAAPKVEREIVAFHDEISTLILLFESNVCATLWAAIRSPETSAAAMLLTQSQLRLDSLTKRLSKLLTLERFLILRSTRITPLELRVARTAAYSAIAAAILAVFGSIGTGWFEISKSREERDGLAEISKKQLYSEFKLRLGRIGEVIADLSDTRVSNIVIGLKHEVLNAVDGDQTKSNDVRAALSLDRIIFDLEQQQHFITKVSGAAKASLELKHMVDGTRDYNATLADKCLADLQAFAQTNGF